MSRIIVLENDAEIAGLKLPMRRMLKEADKIYARHGRDLVVTCGLNGAHSAASYHPFGYAVDLRTNFFGEGQALSVRNELKETLGKYFDVILHASHMHVEFDIARFLRSDPSTNDIVLYTS